ncbi:MAG: T9SS type A sorting domain-containing protein, partial [Lentimicrobiaceae bacterium]|nr:T9SS type A sorting domain-containing protein [Lentimicrobiaceae bacterium]
VSQLPSDMAYDYTTNVMYGINRVELTSYLVKINMQTGAMTTVGSTDKRLYTLACSPEGVLFAIDGSGNLCTINKTTAAATVVGATGVSVHYIQTMSFDPNTGRLFWAMCNTSDEGKLMELHPTTGIAFDRGAIAGNAELIGLFTKPVIIIEEFTVTLQADPVDGGTLIGEGTYLENELVTITAEPHTNYEFVAWMQGTDTVSKNMQHTFNMPAENVTFTAIFKLKNSIDNHELSNIKVYSHLNNIHIVNEENILSSVQVFDMLGSVIYSNKINSSTVFSLNVATGSYLVRLISEDGNVSVTKVYITR